MFQRLLSISPGGSLLKALLFSFLSGAEGPVGVWSFDVAFGAHAEGRACPWTSPIWTKYYKHIISIIQWIMQTSFTAFAALPLLTLPTAGLKIFVGSPRIPWPVSKGLVGTARSTDFGRSSPEVPANSCEASTWRALIFRVVAPRAHLRHSGAKYSADRCWQISRA